MIDKTFILAGKAIFTIQPSPGFRLHHPGCKPHYTYKVRHKEARGKFAEAFFVSLLTGPDNENDYVYVGMLSRDGTLRTTRNSMMAEDSIPVKLLANVLKWIWAGKGAEIEAIGCKVCHAGKCGRCGLKLTTPESVSRGYGPECWGIIEKAVA